MRHSARRKMLKKRYQAYREHKQRKQAKRAKAQMVNRGRQLNRSPALYNAVKAVGFIARNVMWVTTNLTPVQPSIADIAEKISKKERGRQNVPPKPKQVGAAEAAAA